MHFTWFAFSDFVFWPELLAPPFKLSRTLATAVAALLEAPGAELGGIGTRLAELPALILLS